jgi:D-arginine dehydrogenase
VKVDVAVIGAGIAGAGVAAELAPYRSVALLEAESVPGYHSTGRSAAFWHETLGGPQVATLTRASQAALQEGGF